MKAQFPDNAAQMVLRAWIESGSEKPLRVRVHLPSQLESTDRYFSDGGEVGRMVEAWLDELQAVGQAN
jgi:hypothetical protein